MRLKLVVIPCAVALAGTAIAFVPGTLNAQNMAGDKLFAQRCAACHSIIAGKAGGVGPNLRGVVGRRAGSTNYAYSPAMKSSGIVWTAKNLEGFLAAPTKKVPGTKMALAVTDPAQRTELIRYLTSAK